MSHVAHRSGRIVRGPRPRRGLGRLLLAAAAAIGLAGVTGQFSPDPANLLAPTKRIMIVTSDRAAASVEKAAATPPARIAWMLDPTPALGAAASGFGQGAPLEPAFRQAASTMVASLEAPEPVAAPERAPRLASPEPEPARLAQLSPLPTPRPAEWRRSRALDAPRMASRAASPSTRTVFRAAAVPESSFFETLFGIQPSSGEAVAYAALESDPAALTPRRRISPMPGPFAGPATAIYDISARTVRLPSGETIEAHSGLGAAMDNPRHVHIRMRGATPPGVYDLTEREQLFHGVRALRLNPVGGSAAIHGRDGLLAHTYMLGPSGASNGCVSFRNYDRFLQAYLRGDIRRLIVVAGDGQDGPPMGDSRIGMSGRSMRQAFGG